MVGHRVGAWRWGPQHLPHPGWGVALFNVESERRLFVITWAAEEIINCGIALPDMATFMDSPRGVDCFKHAQHIVVPPRGSAWVPPGFVPMCLTLEGEENGYFVAAPLLSVAAAGTLSAPVITAMKKWCVEGVTESKSDNHEWTAAAEHFKSFCARFE